MVHNRRAYNSPTPPTPPPRTPEKRPYARETTRSDRIRIKAALDWATPRRVHKRYANSYGTICDGRKGPATFWEKK
jgi:hypothetical protein